MRIHVVSLFRELIPLMHVTTFSIAYVKQWHSERAYIRGTCYLSAATLCEPERVLCILQLLQLVLAVVIDVTGLKNIHAA